MNVLIIGSGGREHAIAWKISQSKLLNKLFIAPGNAGTAHTGKNVSLKANDFEGIRQFVLENDIGMIIVGPEAPLVAGFHDFFLADDKLKDIPVIGPVRKAALLEGSKDFAKSFMKRHNIPTASYQTFDKAQLKEAMAFLAHKKPPYVLKADGLAAGKGVLICETLEAAEKELKAMFQGKFGYAGRLVVIEEFLKGIELSVFVLTDGKDYLLLPEAKDYKRIGEGDTGLNTGGMGSISPVPFADKTFMDKVENRIIRPTIEGLKAEGIKYKGFLFFGLMKVNDDPYVIEYNVRMGDPEAESVIPRIKSDLLEMFVEVADETIKTRTVETDARYSAAVMLVSGGYPGTYEKDKTISGLENIDNSILFHAGTKTDPESGKVLTNGGRVIAVTSFGNNLREALQTSYGTAEKIEFDKVYYRKDLGEDLTG